MTVKQLIATARKALQKDRLDLRTTKGKAQQRRRLVYLNRCLDRFNRA